MSKTRFSKSELSNLHYILSTNKMLPCEKIRVATDVYNSGVDIIYSVMKFVKGKEQLNIGMVTRTYPRTQKLEEQLIKYFGGEHEQLNS